MQVNNRFEYSVLMSTYKNEKPEYLKEALDSMIKQTLPPTEIVLVKDGPLTKELEELLDHYTMQCPGLFRFIINEQSEGLGKALRMGVLACRCEWIARMDSDDISVHTRCEKQAAYLQQNPDIDMVGSYYYEFFEDSKESVLRKSVSEHEEIELYMHRRNPFGHDSLMIRKNRLLEAGNYQDEIRFEDYGLWIRMMMNGAKMHNLEEPLLYVRGNSDYYRRRGGLKYVTTSISFFKKYRKMNFFTLADCCISLLPRIIVCIVPDGCREWIYKSLLRKKVETKGQQLCGQKTMMLQK